MILGMSTASFTLFHVIISLIGLASGVVVVIGMLQARRLPAWSALFLLTTVATSVTGFLFHSVKFGPPHVVGVLSLIALAVAIAALYGYKALLAKGVVSHYAWLGNFPSTRNWTSPVTLHDVVDWFNAGNIFTALADLTSALRLDSGDGAPQDLSRARKVASPPEG